MPHRPPTTALLPSADIDPLFHQVDQSLTGRPISRIGSILNSTEVKIGIALVLPLVIGAGLTVRGYLTGNTDEGMTGLGIVGLGFLASCVLDRIAGRSDDANNGPS